MNSRVKEYMELPYNRVVQKIKDESGEYYVCKILELDGCSTWADTFEELEANIKEAMQGYLETKFENGFDVPLPVGEEDYSGKFVLRLPKQLHQRLSIEAKEEGVSLNQYALYKLAR